MSNIFSTDIGCNFTGVAIQRCLEGVYTHLATVMAYIKFTKSLQLFLWVNKFILRSCLNLYRQVFYRAKIGCLFIFQGHMAGYVTAKKKETDVFEYKKTAK